ncbi:hypothetical protein Sango_2660300 [Sesamum angolense]|uniref:Uncharacterized protein n=1 Tax=Sesamum angolense TaxID=2727404 RepID=A0AAE1W267_9LAMI|nr:hypothetical protein Sango_2660300 [Sesamum angolense]
MVNPGGRQFTNDHRINDVDQNSDGEESIDVSSSGSGTLDSGNSSLMRRLTEVLVEDGDEDLLLQRSYREDGVLQWIRALDMQVLGACRADERLKPLLKLNVSTGVAEDRLLAHLSQHFEPSEVGLLARCLCAPFVSIRVGKINKKGMHLFPTSKRGNLCLTLLPTSDLRISFNGDDGSVERMATLSSQAQCAAIDIEEISADSSGRSFLIKSNGVDSYFWCSEKSKLHGIELLRKMKDLLMRKPSLAELSGISERRLNCFATNLRAYLAGSTVTSVNTSGEFMFPDMLQSRIKDKPDLSRQALSESSSCQEGLLESLSSFSIAREKLRQRADDFVPLVDSLSLSSANCADLSRSNCFVKDELPDTNGIFPFATSNFLESFSKSVEPPHAGQKMQQVPSGLSHISPHYCLCPPVASMLQYTLRNPQLPSSTESLSLPPLSSLLSAAGPSTLLTSKPSPNLGEVPPLDFPSLLPEPLGRLPNSQQIPTFTPLICDPIVHIPVIDVCSSGPGYLVSAGPARIPPINSNLVDCRLPNAECTLEQSARETLRMLIGSSNQPSSQLLEVLPSVLSSSEDKQNILVTGSRGLYSGIRDIDATSSSKTTMELVFSTEKSLESALAKDVLAAQKILLLTRSHLGLGDLVLMLDWIDFYFYKKDKIAFSCL